MNYTVIAYIVYLIITVSLTIWVASTLHKNGKIFLMDICHNQSQLAIAINELLQVGFYLINLGFAIVRLKINGQRKYDHNLGYEVTTELSSMQNMIEVLSSKIGGFILILGLMLFVYFFILLLIRGGAKDYKQNEQNKVTSNVVVKGV